jgi:hypothetical protein
MFGETCSRKLVCVGVLAMLVGACSQPQEKQAGSERHSPPQVKQTCSKSDSARQGEQVSSAPESAARGEQAAVRTPQAARDFTARFTGRVMSVNVRMAKKRTSFRGIAKHEDGTLIGWGSDQRWLVRVQVEAVHEPAPFLTPGGFVYFWVHSPSRDLGIDSFSSNPGRFMFTLELQQGDDGRLSPEKVRVDELAPAEDGAE